MKVIRTKPVSLEELWEFEDRHPVVFASPSALAGARVIDEFERTKRAGRRCRHRNGTYLSRRGKGIGA
jgi:hypothetical protein